MSALESLLLDEAEAVAQDSKVRPFDAIVVGGGPTGATAARTLAEAGCRVALLEAGPLVLPTHANSTDLRFVGDTVRRLQDGLSYSPRHESGQPFGALVSALGGRGLFWNGAAPRFRESDFAGWPLQAPELAEEYRWAEQELFVTTRWGQSGIASVLRDRLAASGLQAHPEPFAVDARDTIDGWLGGTIGNPLSILLRSNVPLGVGAEARLRVITSAFVTTLDLANDPLVASVALANGTGSLKIAARSAVVAAGGYESVRLAVSSALPDKSGQLGRRLSDHWFVRGYFPLPAETYSSAEPQAAALLIDPDDERPYQVEVHLPARRFFHARRGRSWLPDESETYAAMVRAFAPTQSPDGWLEVHGNEPAGYTVHLPTIDADRTVVDQMRRGLDTVREGLGALPADIETYPLGSSYHEAGGLPMSPTAEQGVVDKWGRAWGDQRVCVVDAAAFPSIGSTNPHLTLVTMARRQSAALAETLL